MASNSLEIFNKGVDSNCAKLLDAYRTLLSKAIISPDNTLTTSNDDLAILTSVENIVFNCQSLLEKIHTLKLEATIRKCDVNRNLSMDEFSESKISESGESTSVEDP